MPDRAPLGRSPIGLDHHSTLPRSTGAPVAESPGAETPGAQSPGAQGPGAEVSRLQDLLLVSMQMMERSDEDEIVHLAVSSGATAGECRIGGAFLFESGWYDVCGPCERPQIRADVEAQFAVLSSAGGPIAIGSETWGWAFPLRTVDGLLGHLVVAADAEPSESTQFILRALAQETGIALMNARTHANERANATQLRIVNTALAESVAALERSNAIHDRLARVAFEGQGQRSIAEVLHELTGYSVAVEDAYGNLRAWAGPGCPVPYPKEPRARRTELLRRVELEGTPLREGDQLVAIAGTGDSRGVLVLHDGGDAGPQDRIAFEYGATVLAMELARTQEAADDDARLRRDLVDDLLHGADEDRALSCAQTLGYDLRQAHRVLVVSDDRHSSEDDELFHAVRRAARDTGAGTLLLSRASTVVVLANDRDARRGTWEQLRDEVQRNIRRGRCRIGVGEICNQVGDFPRSYRQAKLALRIQQRTGAEPQATAIESLGAYQLFGESSDVDALEDFVMRWLGPLLDYDAKKNAELVLTLDRYLAAGRSYDVSARSIGVHRNTLKYRLQRIRDISQLDLRDPDTVFNLQLATRAWTVLLALRDGETS